MTIEGICKKLGIDGKIVVCDVLKSGNINDTFKVTVRNADEEDSYIVQQINTYVFKKTDKDDG